MRRRVLIAIVLAFSTAACTSSSDDSSTTTSVPAGTQETSSSTTAIVTTSTQPPDGFGGAVSMGVELGAETLNPFHPGVSDNRIAGNAVWATVYDLDPETWAKVPDVVTGLPSEGGAITVNEDGTMTVRYEIAAGATWSDGVPISGEDLAWTALAMRDLVLRGTNAVNVDPIMATVTEADAVERLAFITFEEPSLQFEDALWVVLPSHALDGVDLATDDGTGWPSGGPFVVESFEPFASAVLVRNEQYWKTGPDGRRLPHIDRLVISRPQGGLADEALPPTDGFRDRRFDVVAVPPWPEVIDTLASTEADGAVLHAVPTPILEQLTIQFGDGRYDVNGLSRNEDIRMRTAIAAAIDREALIEASGVPWVPAFGILDPRGRSWEATSMERTSVATLVDELEGDGGVATKLSTTGNAEERPAIADALGPQLDAVGIDYEAILMDSVLFFGESLGAGRYDVGLWAWGYTGPIAWLELFDPRVGLPEGNYGNWPAESEGAVRFSEIVDLARSTVDAAELG